MNKIMYKIETQLISVDKLIAYKMRQIYILPILLKCLLFSCGTLRLVNPMKKIKA